MSLDVYLKRRRWISYDCGKTYTEDNETVYDANITHNLGKMADMAGLYEALWRPHRLKPGYNIPESDNDAEYYFEQQDITYAKDIIKIVERGLNKLKKSPSKYKKFNASNGWGTYDGLVKFTEGYLNALKEYPDAIIRVSR